jgi:hypothetical protein
MDLRSDDDDISKRASTSNGSTRSPTVPTLTIPDGWPTLLNTHGYPHSLKISKGLTYFDIRS